MELKEKLVRLDEMKDSIDQTLANIEKVAKQQETLVGVIESSDKCEEFKDFCNELKSQIENLNSQKKTLLHRKDLLESILFECKEWETSRVLIKKLLDLFGIFEET